MASSATSLKLLGLGPCFHVCVLRILRLSNCFFTCHYRSCSFGTDGHCENQARVDAIVQQPLLKRKGTVSDTKGDKAAQKSAVHFWEKRIEYFKEIQNKLLKMTFEEVQSKGQELVSVYELPNPNAQPTGYCEAQLDYASLSLYPEDAPKDMVPVHIGSDGNCLPRCGSLFMFGTEDGHTEVRVRTQVELACNEDYYLSDDLCNVYLQYCESYLDRPYSEITDEDWKQLFR